MRNPLERLLKLTTCCLLLVLMASCSDRDSAEVEPFYAPAEEEWELVWSDEFDGDSLDAAGWDIQLGDGADVGLTRWGNNEQQWYTAENISVADGNLTITALFDQPRPDFCCTSARIRTAGKFDFKYGRAEARVRAASGQGMWNAFWMLPTDSPYGGWASSGEIDVMEVINAGTDAEDVWISLHHGFAWPFNQIRSESIESIDPSGDFHVYAIEWEEDEIRWYIDDTHYMTIASDHWYSYFYADQQTGYKTGEGAAPFNADFHLLLNLAVGGNGPGPVDTSALPSEMVVDYVRVYRCSYNEPDGGGCNSNADRSLETPPSQSPFEASFPLYTDGAEPLRWTIAGEAVERPLAVNSFWDNNALSFAEVGEGDRGMVIDISTSNSGNISINAVDGAPTSLFGFGNNPNWWELGAGELKFDLYVDSENTDPNGALLIKMDSGWPALGFVELAVADLPSDEWTTISVNVNDLLHPDNSGADPLDTDSIVSFFVLEPTSSAHVKVDNIVLKCGHPARNGCGVLPPGGEVDGEVVNVFIDQVDPIWTNGIGAWDTGAGADYFDGASGNHITWSVMSSGDPERENILNVNFGGGSADGVFYVQSAAGIDLSPFAADGKLIFDLRLQAGSTHGIVYKVDCMFPCTSGDQVLDVSGHVRGEWTTVEIPVASLVGGGLDITRVNTGIVIFPPFGEQQGVSFDLDNIRWEIPSSTTGPVAGLTLEVLDNGVPAPIWDQGVGAFDEQIGWGSCFGNGEDCPSVGWEIAADAERGDVLEINYAGPGAAGVFVQASADMDLSDYAEGFVNFDINVVDAGSNSSGFIMKVDCVFPCTSGDQQIGVIGLGDWETVSVPVPQLVAGGLDLTTVNTGLVIWPAFTEQTGVVFRLDDVNWTSGPPSAGGGGLAVFADQLEDVWELWDCCGGANVSVQDSGGEYGQVAELSFTGAGGTVSGFLYGGDPDAATSLDVSAYAKLEFDARVVSHPDTGDDTWLIKIESENAAQFAEVNLNTSVEGQSPVEGQWQHYTFNLADLSGVDWSQLQIILIFPPWGTAQGGLIQIDNVQFTQ